MMKPEVAIIGGGWAGMACAVELADHAIPVILLEAARQLGGRARRVEWHGLGIDNGQHLMIGAYRETLRLLDRLNTGQRLERRCLELLLPDFHLRLHKWPAPLHLAVGLLFARGLRLHEKMAAVRFMRQLQAIDFKLATDISTATLLTRHKQSAQLQEKLWKPICIAALNTPAELASGQVFCNVLRDSLAGLRADSDLLMNRADLGKLVADVVPTYLEQRQCEVRMNSRVEVVAQADDGFHLHGCNVAARQVVLAVHPARVPALLSGLPNLTSIVSTIEQFTWQPILTLWLHFAAAPDFPFPMLALGDSTDPWAFERNDIAPGIVAIVMSAEGAHLQLSPEQLRDTYLDLLARRLGPLPELLDWKTIIEKRATYTCVPDMQRPHQRTPIDRLYLAGDYTANSMPTQTYPATLEGAVRSGVECARIIIADHTR